MANKMVIVQIALVALLSITLSSDARYSRSTSLTSKQKETARILSGIRLELVKQLEVCPKDKIAAKVYQLGGYIFSRCLFKETVIHGYDARTYRHLGDTRWTIPGDTVITDLFANPKTRSLYIRVNSKDGTVGTDTWRITLNNHSSTLYNSINYQHTMYSVSAKDHALVEHQITRGTRRLSVFGADGREFHRISLRGGKENSLIEETESDTFLLGQRYTEDDPYAFKEISRYGSPIKSYQLYNRRNADKISHPYQVVKDKFGNMFVSDVTTPSLYVTDKDITMSRQLLTANTSNRGFTSIAYDPESERLLVVTSANPRHVVDIYQIKYDQ